ncbi:MAG: helix-turn-helix domain-containing protein [Oscillospiraceae bacterium]|nr:helix-turn-helix domain-containing protein [Oscillospiraceae bacterium]MBQ6402912.1 helix-turn-helix domain-containing protein [Oscillospiraceae bacterium]
MNPESIGAFIRQIRKEKGMTQEQLAELLGTSQRSVSRWENGKTMPDLSLYEPLCEALGIQVSELLYAKKMTNDEKAAQGETSALNLLTTKSQLETFAILAEILIVVGIIISITLTSLLATTFWETILTLVSGWFVWGFGLLLRVKIRKAIMKLEQR